MFFFPITRKGRARQKLARTLYAQCVEQARLPVFYTELAVPDTFDGRFELTVLHTGLLVTRLSECEPEKEKLSQAIFDDMFVNMDRTCREIGIGDLSVPRHIKRMMKALKGRTLTYIQAIAQGPEELADALARNMYGTVARPPDRVLESMSSYILEVQAVLALQDFESFSAGRITFPQPSAQRVNEEDDKNSKAA
jgi:cytochrome b pre-mRNA-processing protein 3